MSNEAVAARLGAALDRLVAVVGDYGPGNQDAVDSAISEAIGAMEAALSALRAGEVPDA